MDKVRTGRRSVAIEQLVEIKKLRLQDRVNRKRRVRQPTLPPFKNSRAVRENQNITAAIAPNAKLRVT
jgi:hypothetical protein